MEKIIYIIVLILLENTSFYDNIKNAKIMNYDFLVNKNYKLDKAYVPEDLENISLEFACKDKKLRHDAKLAFEKMAKDAKKEGNNIIAVSAFRNYEYQEKLYNNYTKKYGKYYSALASAKAGHSEHQTGLSVDVADISLDYDNFENTKEFKWMINNSYKYGFILRYPKASFHITGFKYEPWHYRYVGENVAKFIYEKGITLEDYKKDF